MDEKTATREIPRARPTAPPGLLSVSLVFLCCAGALHTQDRPGTGRRAYPPHLPDARPEVYRKVGDVTLRVWIFEPAGAADSTERAAVVFFFGGGWRKGSPAQFAPQCRHLARRGMVAIVADYRVRSRHKTLAEAAVDDARCAVRWVRQEATRLRIDPARIAAGGGSAGGHLAACTAVLGNLGGPSQSPSSVPNALALFNPGVLLGSVPGKYDAPADKLASWDERTAGDRLAISPYHFVRAGLPPTLILHGTDDQTVPFRTVEIFAEAMRAVDNRCELIPYRNEGHGFFNPGRGDGSGYASTLARLDEFFVKIGFLRTAPSATESKS